MNPTSIRGYRSEVLDYLRDVYGVRDAEVVPATRTGNHPHVEFTYRGRRRTLTIHGSAMRITGNALAMKKQDIRRDLGPPPAASLTRNRRSLEDMTAELQAKTAAHGPVTEASPAPSRAYEGRIALEWPSTRKNPKLKFIISRELRDTMGWGAGTAISVHSVGDDTFELRANPSRKTPVFRELRSGKEFELVIEKVVQPGPDVHPFGASPAEFVIVDDKVAARIIERRPQRKRGVKSTTNQNATTLVKVAEDSLAKADKAWQQSELMESALSNPRAVLAAIYRVEHSTPYRLVKLEGKGWAWRAPTITLRGD